MGPLHRFSVSLSDLLISWLSYKIIKQTQINSNLRIWQPDCLCVAHWVVSYDQQLLFLDWMLELWYVGSNMGREKILQAFMDSLT
jgi:hypothetical protein